MDEKYRRELLAMSGLGREVLAQLDDDPELGDPEEKAKRKKEKKEKAAARAEKLARMNASLEQAGLRFAADSKSNIDFLLSMTPTGRAALESRH